jgi:hypothetical protein
MKKIKAFKKEEFDFDITKIKEVEKVDIFEDRVEITFLTE